MKKTFLFLLFLPLLLISRENPFFPVENEQKIPLTSNEVTYLPMLKRATLTLPSTARTIEGVTIKYKNLDGSIAKKRIRLQNKIDWHLPIFISQDYGSSPEMPKVLKKKINNKIIKKEIFTQVASLGFITFYVNGKKLKLITKDKILRNFLLVKPHRIVCDFKRQTDMKSFIKAVPKKALFTKIKVGTHSGYYRVVIELDGYYKYELDKIPNGYMLSLI
ncbi:AMIN domain-containing protein [Sulfurimonas sp.]